MTAAGWGLHACSVLVLVVLCLCGRPGECELGVCMILMCVCVFYRSVCVNLGYGEWVEMYGYGCVHNVTVSTIPGTMVGASALWLAVLSVQRVTARVMMLFGSALAWSSLMAKLWVC